MIVTIVGLGLMGGSLALSLNDINFCTKLIGVETNELNRKQALELNLVNEISALNEAITHSDIIIVATPVVAAINIISKVLDKITENQVVIDLGSTKASICYHFSKHPNRQHYVAAHPIAGTENSGPQAAINSLYNKKKCHMRQNVVYFA